MTHPSKSLLLAIDTSSQTAGLAIYDGEEVMAEFTWTSQDHHTVELAPSISDAFDKTKITYSDLAALAVAIGPGSFTGLRIGLALAKGIAIARKIPLIAIPTLDFLAVAQPPHTIPMAAALRAGRGRLAICWYIYEESGWKSTGAMDVMTPQELILKIKSDTLVCGELTNEERLLFKRESSNVILASPAFSLRRTAFLAEIAWNNWQKGQVDDPASVAPIYLHYNQPIPE